MATLALAALAGCGSARAPAPEPAPTAHPPAAATQARRLDSGLLFSVESRPGDASAAFALAVPGGVLDAPAGSGWAVAAQLAVLDPEAPGGLAAEIATRGGTCDAWVEPDTTWFTCNLAPEELPGVLEALAARLASPLAPEAADALRVRVDQHAAAGHQAPLRALLSASLALAANGDGNASGRGVAGGGAAEALSAEAVEAFRRAHHRPEGAALAVVGPFDAERDLSALTTAALRWGGPSARTPRAESPGATHTRTRPEIIVHNERTDRARFAIATPARVATPAAAAHLDLLALTLSDPDGPLAVPGAALPTVFTQSGGASGAWMMTLAETDAADVDRAWDVVTARLRGPARLPPTEAAVSRARRRLLTAIAHQTAAPGGRAIHLAAALRRWPDAAPDAYLRAVRAATSSALAGSADSLTLEQSVATVIAPAAPDVDLGLWAERLAERLTAPLQATSTRAGLNRLRPGIEVLVHPTSPAPGPDVAESDAVTVYLAARGGLAMEPGQLSGLAALVAELAAAPVPGDDAVLGWVAADHLALVAAGTADRLAHLLRAVADRATALDCAPARLEFARERALGRARARDARADAARRSVLGEVPHARSPAGEPAIIAQLDCPALLAWGDAHLARAPWLFVVTGPVDPLDVRRALAALDPAPRSEAEGPAASIGAPPAPANGGPPDGRAVIAWSTSVAPDVESLAQRAVLLEALAGPGAALHARLAAIDVMATARLLDADGALPVVALEIRGAAERQDALVRQARAEMDRLRRVDLEPAEIDAARRRVASRARSTLADPTARARWLAQHALAGRPLVGADAVSAWIAALERVTPATLRTFANAHVLDGAPTPPMNRAEGATPAAPGAASGERP